MILPGQSLITRKIIQGLTSSTVQTQPCGVDLTLKRVLTWTSHGSIDFDNTRRQTASTKEIPFELHTKPGSGITSQVDNTEPNPLDQGHGSSIHLPFGSYLVEFNETVSVPLDVMGEIFVRSSLFRSGALLSAGVMDSGYEGSVGALLQVVNPLGLQLYKDARLA